MGRGCEEKPGRAKLTGLGGSSGSSQQQQQQQHSPHGLSTPLAGWLSSTLLFCLQGLRGWEMGGEAVGPV